ncbi:ABC transporter substrate-binding protein [Lentzea sp. NBRC 105346]|uniref:ABC transporter substrate-binding protein n=1 Tax=Lentzea sp. NBRC 105346 TaxID=3032205 RepID=UPI0024A0E1B0|nr:ABC transporter substrate-binding protein [Lentzea sp. NBRC 105346]GLZ35410.1 ABC transporter substrate-binding protein [Lentzea sp. NBRC 105346]
MRIGVVLAHTGRLALLGSPLEYVARTFGEHEMVLRDSHSTAAGARRAASQLILQDKASLILTLGGTDTVPAVAETCERLRTPCLSTVLPWQVWLGDRDPRWSFHFCWGLDDIATVFADMWEQVAPACTVGCLWNDGPQGEASRRWFAPVARERGHHLVDPGYREDTGAVPDFSGVDVITGAPTAEDLARLRVKPKLITCSRWLTYPFGVAKHGLVNVATIVSWTPHHTTGGHELAASYEKATNRPWLQPLGLARALFEVASHVMSTDKAEIAHNLRHTNLETVAGRLDWTNGPAPGVATVALAGGQWRAGPELMIVSNQRTRYAPVTGQLIVNDTL